MNIRKVNTIMSGAPDYVYNFVFDLYYVIMTHVPLPSLPPKKLSSRETPGCLQESTSRSSK